MAVYDELTLLTDNAKDTLCIPLERRIHNVDDVEVLMSIKAKGKYFEWINPFHIAIDSHAGIYKAESTR